MSTHKRSSADRDITWRPPEVNCYACYDTGIVSNGDGILSAYLPDYDTTPSGMRHGGLDLAIICHCPAAYPEHDQDGKTTRGGLRVNGAPAIIGNQRIGADISKDIARQIHQQRATAWKTTAAEMNAIRQSIAAGMPYQQPAYITAVKAKLKSIATLLPSCTP